MAVREVITAFLIILLMAMVNSAQAGGGGGGGGGGAPGVPVDLLLPDPPTHVTATAGDADATVTFDTPKSNGGSPITGYTVIPHPRAAIVVRGQKSPIVVRGLTNGKTYNFTVSATNSVGTGIESQPSNSVTPKAQ